MKTTKCIGCGRTIDCDMNNKQISCQCGLSKQNAIFRPICTPIDFLSPSDHIRIENYQKLRKLIQDKL